ncbi:ABC transporter permease subunit [Azotosporobacter soli]|uniref:ABC transporter permease subunit n=1 Tax=Azotosporobacter soli TaxID=3055040 RepID=UPI0031FEE9AC
MGFQFDSAFFVYEIGIGIRFIPIVLLLSVIPLLLGLSVGGVIAVIRLLKVPLLHSLAALAVTFLRGVPLLLQLTILYLAVNIGAESLKEFGLGGFSAKDISYTWVAVAGLSIHAAVYLSEVIRSALLAVPAGQYEAARAVGMNNRQLLLRIIVPQAMPVALPLIGSNFIGLIKGSAVASLISVVELLNGTQFEANGNYKFLEAYLAAALLYWLLCFLVEQVIAFGENKLRASGWSG